MTKNDCLTKYALFALKNTKAIKSALKLSKIYKISQQQITFETKKDRTYNKLTVITCF